MLAFQALPRIVANSLKFLEQPPKTRSLRLATLDVLINCILYNPPMAFHIIESSGAGLSRVLFDKWFKALGEPGGLPRVHDMKLSVMAMCALLELDEASIPETLKDGWVSIVGGALTVFKMLPNAVNGRRFSCQVGVVLIIENQNARKNKKSLLQTMIWISLTKMSSMSCISKKMVCMTTFVNRFRSLRLVEEDVWDEDSALREVLAQRVGSPPPDNEGSY